MERGSEENGLRRTGEGRRKGGEWTEEEWRWKGNKTLEESVRVQYGRQKRKG